MIFATLALWFLSDGNLRAAELVMLAEILTHLAILGFAVCRRLVRLCAC